MLVQRCNLCHLSTKNNINTLSFLVWQYLQAICHSITFVALERTNIRLGSLMTILCKQLQIEFKHIVLLLPFGTLTGNILIDKARIIHPINASNASSIII